MSIQQKTAKQLGTTEVAPPVAPGYEHPRSSAERPSIGSSTFREMFENSPVGMYISTPAGKYVAVNRALAALFGYPSPEALENELDDIRELFEPPCYRDVIVAELESSNTMLGKELKMRRKDGRVISIFENVRVIRDADGKALYYEGTIQDISTKKAAEDALYKSEQRYRALVESSNVGVFLSIDGKCVFANAALGRMLGYTISELNGKSYRDLYAPESRDAADARHVAREKSKQGDCQIDAVLLCKDGATRIDARIAISSFLADSVLHTAGTVLDMTTQRHAEKTLRHNAQHDGLTGLPNRAYFNEQLTAAIADSASGGRGYAALFLDLDGFKFINDAHGHAQGDLLLMNVAHRLKNCLPADTTIARHGGDEFTILVRAHDARSTARHIAESIQAEMTKSFVFGENEFFMSASIGIAIGAGTYSTPDQVLRDADTAMYAAKSQGKARCAVFTDEMHNAVKRHLEIGTELHTAIKEGHLVAYYQPIYELKNGTLKGAEALLRWDHPVRGLLAPDAFFDVAEESGMLAKMSWWMLRSAVGQLSAWRKVYSWAKDLSLSINVCDWQFSDPRFIEILAEILAEERDVPRDRICLELTETVFMKEPDRALRELTKVKRLGVQLHLDDFGTGYSSLNHLGCYPLDMIKVDRSFISDMETNPRRLGILRAVTTLASTLDIRTVAEGIETVFQLENLRELGFKLGQGYLLAKPMDADAFSVLAGEHQHRILNPDSTAKMPSHRNIAGAR